MKKNKACYINFALINTTVKFHCLLLKIFSATLHYRYHINEFLCHACY